VFAKVFQFDWGVIIIIIISVCNIAHSTEKCWLIVLDVLHKLNNKVLRGAISVRLWERISSNLWTDMSTSVGKAVTGGYWTRPVVIKIWQKKEEFTKGLYFLSAHISKVIFWKCLINNSHINSQQDATVHQNLLFHVYIKFHMFRATHRPTSWG